MKKMKFDFEFIREQKSNEEFIDKLKVYQIIALEDNPKHGVKKGDRGGKVFVQFDNQLGNLTIEDTSWIMEDASIFMYEYGHLTVKNDSVIKSGILTPKGDSIVSNSIIDGRMSKFYLDVEGMTSINGVFNIVNSTITECSIRPLTEVNIMNCKMKGSSIERGVYTNCTIDNSRVHGIISDSIIKDTIGFSTLSYRMGGKGGKLCHSKEGVSGLQVINDIVSVR